MIMKSLRRLSIAMLVAMTAAVPSDASGKESVRWFSIRYDSNFADARAQLQVLVDANGHGSANRFCVVGQAVGGDRQAYVYWPTENKLILWEPQSGNPRAILGSRRYLDLRKDVVEGGDVHGSTYQLTRRFVNAALRACRRTGETFSILRHEAADTHG